MQQGWCYLYKQVGFAVAYSQQHGRLYFWHLGGKDCFETIIFLPGLETADMGMLLRRLEIIAVVLLRVAQCWKHCSCCTMPSRRAL